MATILNVDDEYSSPPPAYSKKPIDSNQNDDRVESSSSPVQTTGGPKGRKIVLILLACILMCVLLGGVLGGVVSKKTSSNASPNSRPTSKSNPSPTMPPIPVPTGETSRVTSDSKLAATNWTDEQNVIHHAVFFQDQSNRIAAFVWDSKGREWSDRNIFGWNPELVSLVPADKASISVATANQPPFFQINLYILDEYNQIRELITTDPDLMVWNAPDLNTPANTVVNNLVTNSNSQLAAYYWAPTADQSLDHPVLVYQAFEGTIKYSNNTRWANDMLLHGSNKVRDNAAIAMMPAKFNQTGLDLDQLNVYVGEYGNVIKEYGLNDFDAWTGSQWQPSKHKPFRL